MPRGRFLNKEICIDKTVNELSSFECMLAFTWLIPHLDKEGRTYGDPAIVRSMVFPRRSDISIEKMQSFLKEWHDAGLIVWYEVRGDMYIWFPNFDKHQRGLDKSREADSVIPAPDQLATNSGVTPDQLPVKVKVKLIKGEVNDKDEDAPTPYSQLSKTFTEVSEIPELTGGKQKYGNAIKKMVDMKVTPDILEQAILEMKDKDLTIATPASCLKACAIVIGKRKGRTREKDAEDPTRYLKGEYGEFGKHW